MTMDHTCVKCQELQNLIKRLVSHCSALERRLNTLESQNSDLKDKLLESQKSDLNSDVKTKTNPVEIQRSIHEDSVTWDNGFVSPIIKALGSQSYEWLQQDNPSNDEPDVKTEISEENGLLNPPVQPTPVVKFEAEQQCQTYTDLLRSRNKKKKKKNKKKKNFDDGDKFGKKEDSDDGGPSINSKSSVYNFLTSENMNNDSDNDHEDVLHLRDDFESGTEWRLRRQFLKANKDSLPLDRLICLSRCFVNMAIYQCSYPPSVMEEVRERSNGVLDEIEKVRQAAD